MRVIVVYVLVMQYLFPHGNQQRSGHAIYIYIPWFSFRQDGKYTHMKKMNHPILCSGCLKCERCLKRVLFHMRCAYSALYLYYTIMIQSDNILYSMFFPWIQWLHDQIHEWQERARHRALKQTPSSRRQVVTLFFTLAGWQSEAKLCHTYRDLHVASCCHISMSKSYGPLLPESLELFLKVIALFCTMFGSSLVYIMNLGYMFKVFI